VQRQVGGAYSADHVSESGLDPNKHMIRTIPITRSLVCWRFSRDRRMLS
jgi:hypothetical protein